MKGDGKAVVDQVERGRVGVGPDQPDGAVPIQRGVPAAERLADPVRHPGEDLVDEAVVIHVDHSGRDIARAGYLLGERTAEKPRAADDQGMPGRAVHETSCRTSPRAGRTEQSILSDRAVGYR